MIPIVTIGKYDPNISSENATHVLCEICSFSQSPSMYMGDCIYISARYLVYISTPMPTHILQMKMYIGIE
jgi:hypothetical protein